MRCPRAEFAAPLPGSFGHHADRQSRTGPGGAALDWDRRARVTPVSERSVSAPRLERPYRTMCPAASQEAWPEAAPSGRKPFRREPWWNADRRARSADLCAQNAYTRLRSARAAPDGADGWKHASVGVPLPFILSVIASPSEAKGEAIQCSSEVWIASSLPPSRSAFRRTQTRRSSPSERRRGAPCNDAV